MPPTADVTVSAPDFAAANAPAAPAATAPATPAPAAFVCSTAASIARLTAFDAEWVDFCSASSAPARMSAGVLVVAPDVGEIEISSSSRKSITLSSPMSGAAGAGDGPGCAERGSAFVSHDVVSAAASMPAPAVAAAAAAAAALPPSLNIGLDGSSWRPSATAFCQVSPCPCDTE